MKHKTSKWNQFKGEKLIAKKLPSGLHCYIIPKAGYLEKQAAIVCRYGGADTVFDLDGVVHKVPEGTAHFIEHKMFENPTGSAFDAFSGNGAYVNAYTSFNATVYYFSCTQDFEKNLRLLMETVSTPYFTTENIEKERPIIAEEIKMYEDDPGWRIYLNLLNELFRGHPIANNMAGSASSIADIDTNVLGMCYKAFYQPANLSLITCGDVSAEVVLDIAKDYLNESKKHNVTRVYGDANKQNAVLSHKVSDQMNVARPLFLLGIKDAEVFENGGKPSLKQTAAVRMAWDLLLGESAVFKDNLMNRGLLDDNVGFEHISGCNAGYTLVSGQCKDPDAWYEAVEKQLADLQKNQIPEADFERIKRKHTGRFLRSLNAIDNVTRIMSEALLKEQHVNDVLESIHSVSYQDALCVLDESRDLKRTVLSVIEPM